MRRRNPYSCRSNTEIHLVYESGVVQIKLLLFFFSVIWICPLAVQHLDSEFMSDPKQRDCIGESDTPVA